MNPEDFNYFQSRVTRFISSSNRRSSSGSFLSPKITRLSGIIPKRALPSQIFSRPTASADDAIESSGRGISSLGRVTLDLEIINNNLDRIRQIIEQDYKNTQETNRKETEDFRKRVANRGRIFGKRELGDKKSDLLGAVKKYVGSFFSGTGGAIRALAMWNLMQGILSGDPKKIIGPLLGIGLTYIPGIVGNIVSGAAGLLVGRMFGGGAVKGAEQIGTRGLVRGAEGAAELGRFGKFARIAKPAALLGGGIYLGSKLFGGGDAQNTQQQRLEQLTQEQKSSTDPQSLVPVPQDDLKRFENLNKRFEAAIDFLMGKKGGTQGQQQGPGGTTPPPPPPGPTGLMIQDDQQALSELGVTQEQFNAYKQGVADIEGARYNQMGGAGGRFAGRYQMGSGEIASAAAIMGLQNPSRDEFLNNPELQEKIYMGRTILMNRRMMQLSDQYRSIKSNQERLAVLAGAQLGEGNLTDYLAGKTVADSAGVEIQRWINSAKSRLAQASSGTFTPPPAPVLPSPSASRRTSLPTPPRQKQQFNFVPVDSGNQTPSSVATPSNHSAISVDTTHPENFLALYSKLIYQVV